MLHEGLAAPPFALPDQHGNVISLTDFADSWVVLWWFPKADTLG
jgi:thioredoxin-dependent peroxiredoxin